jgi:hypothetical protein
MSMKSFGKKARWNNRLCYLDITLHSSLAEVEIIVPTEA